MKLQYKKHLILTQSLRGEGGCVCCGSSLPAESREGFPRAVFLRYPSPSCKSSSSCSGDRSDLSAFPENTYMCVGSPGSDRTRGTGSSESISRNGYWTFPSTQQALSITRPSRRCFSRSQASHLVILTIFLAHQAVERYPNAPGSECGRASDGSARCPGLVASQQGNLLLPAGAFLQDPSQERTLTRSQSGTRAGEGQRLLPPERGRGLQWRLTDRLRD